MNVYVQYFDEKGNAKTWAHKCEQVTIYRKDMKESWIFVKDDIREEM